MSKVRSQQQGNISLSNGKKILASIAGPKKVVYMDQITTWYPDPTADIQAAANAGFNVIILAFYLSSGPADIVQAWSGVATAQQRQNCLQVIHSKGAVLMMSFGGSTETPYNQDPTQLSTTVANFANQYQFDGIDYDLENFSPGLQYGNLNSQQMLQWLGTLATNTRSILGPNALISFAPQAPYFGPIGGCTNCWPGPLGGFTGLEKALPAGTVDFYNIQYYNQSATCYSTYQGTFIQSSSDCTFSNTAVKELAQQQGLASNKLVVGKPMLPSDASNGYIDPVTLGQWVTQAQSDFGWNAGIMTWQWHDAASAATWLSGIYPSGGNSRGSFNHSGMLGLKGQSGVLDDNGNLEWWMWLIIAFVLAFLIILIILVSVLFSKKNTSNVVRSPVVF